MSKPAASKNTPSPARPLAWIALYEDPQGGYRFAVGNAGLDVETGEHVTEDFKLSYLSPRYPMRIEAEEKFRIWVAQNFMSRDD